MRAESRPTSGFSSVIAEGPADVEVTVGPSHSVQVSCDEDLLPHIRTHVERSSLVIESDWGSGFHFGVSQSPGHCSIAVTLPQLVSVERSGSGNLTVRGRGDGLSHVTVSGSGDATIDSAHASKVDVSVSGSGSLKLHELTAKDASMEVHGSGDLQTAGRATSLQVRANGSGNVDAHELKAEECHVLSHGSANLRVFASRRVDVEASGSSDLVIGGHPAEKQVVLHGSGNVSWE